MKYLLDSLPDVFNSEDALKAGVTPYLLSNLVNDGDVEKIERGLYKKSDAEDFGEWTSFVIASKKVHQKNAICLISALVYHKLAEVIPTTVWLLVDFKTRSTKSGISLLRRREPSWNIGIIKDGLLLVTDIERTLVESMVFKDKVGYNEAYYALKKALDKKNPLTTPKQIIERAKELGFYHLIQKPMEPFIYE
jgi:predicted transcriptional regulator of viral defense system